MSKHENKQANTCAQCEIRSFDPRRTRVEVVAWNVRFQSKWFNRHTHTLIRSWWFFFGFFLVNAPSKPKRISALSDTHLTHKPHSVARGEAGGFFFYFFGGNFQDDKIFNILEEKQTISSGLLTRDNLIIFWKSSKVAFFFLLLFSEEDFFFFWRHKSTTVSGVVVVGGYYSNKMDTV